MNPIGVSTTLVRRGAAAMGTRFEIVLAVTDEARGEAAAEAALDEVADAHAALTRFENSSVVSAIARAAGVEAVPVPGRIAGLLERCVEVEALSGGAFTVVREGDRPARERGLLRVDGSHATLAHAGLGLDLGSVGKGYALDEAAVVLGDAGTEHAFLHGGTSTSLAIGTAPDGSPWRVRLAATGEGCPPTVELVDLAMSVSSQVGERPDHVVDPRTGEAAAGAAVAACLGGSAEETDAWATALIVLGERPPGMPARLTSLIRCSADGSWRVEGPHAAAVLLDPPLPPPPARSAGAGRPDTSGGDP